MSATLALNGLRLGFLELTKCSCRFVGQYEPPIEVRGAKCPRIFVFCNLHLKWSQNIPKIHIRPEPLKSRLYSRVLNRRGGWNKREGWQINKSIKIFPQILGRLQEFVQFHEQTNQHQLKTFDQSQSNQFSRKFMNVSSYSNYAILLKKNAIRFSKRTFNNHNPLENQR